MDSDDKGVIRSTTFRQYWQETILRCNGIVRYIGGLSEQEMSSVVEFQPIWHQTCHEKKRIHCAVSLICLVSRIWLSQVDLTTGDQDHVT